MLNVRVIALWLIFASCAQAGSFTPGNLVVLQSQPTGMKSAGPISLVEYTTTGTGQAPVQTIAISSTGTSKLTQGTGTPGAGHLSRSADGQYVTFVGYGADAGTKNVANTSVLRVIGKADHNGAVSLATNTTAYDGKSITSATSVDGSRYWTGGPGGAADLGLRTITDGTIGDHGTQVADLTVRATHVFNNQLYASTSSSIIKTDTALPTGASTTTALSGVTGFSTGQNGASGFFMLDRDNNGTLDTLYAADLSNGLMKFTSTDGTNWTARGTIAGAVNSVIAANNGTSIDIYVTSGDGTTDANNLQKLTDTSAQVGTDLNFTGFTYSALATALTGNVFRSVAFAPAAVPEPASIVLVGLIAAGGVVFRLRRRSSSKQNQVDAG